MKKLNIVLPLYSDASRSAMSIGGYFLTYIQCFTKLTESLCTAKNLNLIQFINLIPGNGIKGATGQLNSYTDLNVGLCKGCSMVAFKVNKEKPFLLKLKIKYILL